MTDFIPLLPPDAASAAVQLNRECACLSVDHDALQAVLESAEGSLYKEILETRPHLFSDTVVFVGEQTVARMAELIAAIESVIASPAFQKRVLKSAPAIAQKQTAARGVFLGYDFHLDPDGPRLIEINTNAGGGLLNARLAQAQRACCGTVAAILPKGGSVAEKAFIAMFRDEWRLARGDRPLRTVAIVDREPGEQYLAPEFELFRQLFVAEGLEAFVVDPTALAWDGADLRYRGQAVDMVYNRLTDFYLTELASQSLRAAYEADGVVLTPHPRAHALYADKRNLVLLSDEAELAALGVDAATRHILLSGIPPTRLVEPQDADYFWRERRRWFFKPAGGFGSRAAYRGDKITKRVFDEILGGGYIAQAIVAPSERRVPSADGMRELKLDLRNYAYGAEVQLLAARLYQGQTTNFRTPGGGFAAVLTVPESR